MRLRLRFASLYVLLAVAALAASFVTGLEINTTTTGADRPRIGAGATYPAVLGNFTGKNNLGAGTVSELPGFFCKAYTESTNRAKSHWAVLFCTPSVAG